MINTEKLKQATIKANNILIEKLPELEYYNKKNLFQNISTLQRVISSNVLGENQLLVYIASSNTLIIDDYNLDISNVSIELLTVLILHEYLHIASTDSIEKNIGFEDEVLPITYNEALTQWLTLKLYYGKESMDRAVENNFIYPESVKEIHKMIKEIGENYIFNYFFEAKLRKNIGYIPKDKKSIWLDVILKLSVSQEEKNASENLKQMQAKIYEYSNRRKI